MQRVKGEDRGRDDSERVTDQPSCEQKGENDPDRSDQQIVRVHEPGATTPRVNFRPVARE